jgi:hypothetical protein
MDLLKKCLMTLWRHSGGRQTDQKFPSKAPLIA